MSAKSAPHAESALAIDGTSTRRQPSSRAIGTMLRPEAPPPATIVTSRGSIPWAIVISRIAPTMFSEAIVSAAYAASWTERLSGAATARSTAANAASASSGNLPPRK